MKRLNIPNLLFYMLIVFASPIFAANQKIDHAVSAQWKLPPLVLNDLAGQRRTLYDWHGKVIMLNFWATWCGPCQTEIPDFIGYQQQYADRGLQVIGIGLDEAENLRKFVRSVGVNYPILQADPEEQYSLLKQWGNPYGSLPFTVVIGKEGRLIFMQSGLFRKEAFEKFVLPNLQ